MFPSELGRCTSPWGRMRSFEWIESVHGKAMDDLKMALTSAPALATLDYSEEGGMPTHSSHNLIALLQICLAPWLPDGSCGYAYSTSR